MLYIPKIDDYLRILTDEEVKDFVAIIFSQYFKSIRKPKNLRSAANSLYIFLTTPDEVKNYMQILLIIVYITIMLRNSILLIQN